MTDYLEFQSIVNYRIKINSDGTFGNPEITAKWTKELGAKKRPKKVKKEPVQIKADNIQQRTL